MRTLFASFQLPIEDADVLTHLGNHINCKIRNDKELTEKQKDLLLNYPVVYIHTWQDPSGQLQIYVGESYDLTQRTEQHADGSENDEDDTWRIDWGDAIANGLPGNSFFFGSSEMNKSLCLDLENALFRLLKQLNMFGVRTISTHEQHNYSNKVLRNDLLRNIWGVLTTTFHGLPSYDTAVQKAADTLTAGQNEVSYADPAADLVCVHITPDSGSPKSGTSDIPFDKRMIPHILDYLEADICAQEPALLSWPVIYMHVWDNGKHIYVGETDHLKERTKQHLTSSDQGKETKAWQGLKDSWRSAVANGTADMYVFGSPAFNKSVTLDIEHKLIHYTSFLDKSVNGRTNEQKEYSNRHQMQPLFEAILAWLHSQKPDTFKSLDDVIKESVFIASPLLELSEVQTAAKKDILEAIDQALSQSTSEEDPQQQKMLLEIEGGAGTGKTVLASSLFFNLVERGYRCQFAVNHPELLNLYTNMDNAWRLGSGERIDKRISKASTLIGEETQLDIILVDEAHLLYTGGHIGGITSAQLPHLLEKARVMIILDDPDQVMDNDQVREDNFSYEKYCREQTLPIAYKKFELAVQMRMKCAPETTEWIRNLSQEGTVIQPLTHGTHQVFQKKAGNIYLFTDHSEHHYQIAVFENAQMMANAIQMQKDRGEKPSALLASYCWPFSEMVEAGNLLQKWHRTGQTEKDKEKSKENDTVTTKKLWTMAEKADEIGSYHDIQGFDLTYAGVLIGNAVQYQPPRDPQAYRNNRRHLLQDQPPKAGGKMVLGKGILFNEKKRRGSGKDNGNIFKLISNEHYVLLTRATKGLYLYAVDDKLRKALIAAVQGKNPEQK